MPHLDYWDASFREGAFACRVAYSGTKTFIVKIDNARRSVGRYPLISLADARAEAKRMLAQKMLGKSRPQAIKYEVALAEFLDEKRSSRRKRTVDNLEERLIRHFSFKGQLHDISHHDVASRLANLKTTSQYDHALSVARTFFTWAYNHRYIDDNPTRGLSLRGSKGDLIEPISKLAAIQDRLILVEPDADHPLAINPLDIPRTNVAHAIDLLEYLFGALLEFKMTALQTTLFRSVLRALVTVFPNPTLETY